MLWPEVHKSHAQSIKVCAPMSLWRCDETKKCKRVASFIQLACIDGRCSRRSRGVVASTTPSRAVATACNVKSHTAYGVMACTRVNDPLPASAEFVSATGVRVPSANTRCGRSRRFS